MRAQFTLSVVLTFAAIFAPSALAQDGTPARKIEVKAFATPGEARAGSLLLKSNAQQSNTDAARYVEAPRLGTDIDLVVSGPTSRARVTQMFHNPTEGWVEAIYVYPLPDAGAVDTMKMVIGERIVVGEIKERQQARVVYEQAKASGQKASLLEQERPNIFTSSVANIGPGETVVVQIEYQEPVRQSGDMFSLRVPLVVGPRYNPAPVVQTVELRPDGAGWGTVTDPVPDRARIEPPVLDPSRHAPVNPVSIAVRLQAGFALGEVKSHHHAVTINDAGADTRVITLGEGPVPADRDFELTWKPAASAAPSVGLFRERVGDADYMLAFVTPPAVADAEQPRPRETIFVIDNSGSMGGTSIVQAKASLAFALGRLRPTDRFNVIRFDNTMDALFTDPVPASADHVARAKAFVAALQARGGTEMVPPMQAALTDRRGSDNTGACPVPSESGHAPDSSERSHFLRRTGGHFAGKCSDLLRQVVFLTDGAIGNEQQLLDTIAAMRGRSRLFMVGIGSAPNSFLMTRAAEIGRGTFTHIGSVEQVDERMRRLFEKLETPVVTNLTATFTETQAEVTPGVIPDLYRGEPVVLAAKLASLAGTLELQGRIGERPWIVTLPIAGAAEGKGLSKLFARRRIADAEVERTLRTITSEEADKRILALALDHSLVSRLTSLVAVDKTPSRPEGTPLTVAELPLNLPAGWEFDKVFGGERSPGTPTRRADVPPAVRTQFAMALQPAAAPTSPATRKVTVAAAPTGTPLPKTATDAELRMMFGILLVMLSFMLLVFGRWKVAVTRTSSLRP